MGQKWGKEGQRTMLLFAALLRAKRPLGWHIETRFITVFLGQKIIFLASDDGKAFEKQKNFFPLVPLS